MMALQKLKDSQKLLLDILSSSFKKTKYTINAEIDWQEVLKEARQQTVLLQVLHTVNGNLGNFQNEMMLMSVKSMQKNLKIHSFHSYLHKLMSDNGINYCVIKGSSSAYYYENPTLRVMGDVDFLISPDDIERASKVLENDGFKKWEEDHICHIVFRKEKMHYEMHFEPAGIPNGKNGEIIREYLADVFDKTLKVKIDGFEFVKPDDFHHGLIILMHIYHHMLSEGIGLRHLCDWAAFVNSIENECFAELFEEKLKKVGLWKFAQILSGVSYKYLGIEYKEWFGKIDDSLCDDLICDIMSGGNFGRKDKKRANAGMAISNRGKDGLSKSAFMQFFNTMNEAAKMQFPILQRVKILVPFGWLMLTIRRVFRIICGKRQMPEVGGIFESANERKQIYMKFHLFETEENEDVN